MHCSTKALSLLQSVNPTTQVISKKIFPFFRAASKSRNPFDQSRNFFVRSAIAPINASAITFDRRALSAGQISAGNVPVWSGSGNCSLYSSSAKSGGPTIVATPQVCLQDVHTTLTIQGLDPSVPVTVRAQVSNDNGKKFCSHGQFVSSAAGTINLDTAESVGGSYTGVFPAGLLTTLGPAPGEFPYLRLYKKDPMQAWQINMTVHSGHHEVSNESPPDEVCSVLLTRLLMAPGVTRHPVRHGRVRGVMYMPPPQYGPAVGVVDMFGAVGGIMEFRAAMLASRGYAVLSLPFFAYDDLPSVPHTLELEYFEEACHYVMAQKNVIPDRCGMVSVSKSTDIALLLSTKVPQLTGVVCISVVHVSYDTNITYNGKLIVQGVKLGLEHMTTDEKGRLYPNAESIFSNFLRPGVEQAGMLRLVEASPECRYLIVAGSEDTWLCYMCVPYVQQYMERHGREQNLESIIYEGAGHIIEPPYGPHIIHTYQRVLPVYKEQVPKKVENPDDFEFPGGDHGYVTGVPVLFGGKPKETCDAQVDIWHRMQKFLDKSVRDCSPWYQAYLRKNNDN
uniref:Acyl-coenzyme A thioesterase 1-like n=1 Tax=Hirondellea gigas TaxID=1518452 RepID=A0A2P2HZM7_9CRUS